MAVARWTTRSALLLAGAYVVLVGGLNAFMNWGGFELLINNVQPDVTFEIGPSWQWVPGRVRGEDFFLQVHDPGVQMDLHIDEYAVDIDLLAFFEKTFRSTHTKADGLELRLRRTRPIDALCAAPPGLPEIRGHTRPLEHTASDCLAQADTARTPGPKPGPGDVFKVDLGGVEATNVRQIWVEHYRVEAVGALTGAWFFWPNYHFELDLDRFELGQGRLVIADETRVEELELSARAKVDDIALDRPESQWHQVSLDLEAVLRRIDFGLYRTLYTLIAPLGRPPLERVDGHGDLVGAFVLERGLPRKMRTQLTKSAAGVKLGEMRVGGALTFDAAAVATSTTRPGLRFRESFIELRHINVVQGREEPRHYPDSVLRLEVGDGSHVDPTNGNSRLVLHASSSQLKPLFDLIPKGLPKIYADIVLAEDKPIEGRTVVVSDRGTVSLRDIDVRAKALHVTGEVTVIPELLGGLDAKVGLVKVHHDFRAESVD